MTTDELRSKTETEGLWMMQVMCNQDIKRICDGTCNDPCCMQKHPPTTYALQAADELRAKFEMWWTSPRGFSMAIPQTVESHFRAYQAAHASRDAEVEALRKDAERYRAFRRAAIREDDSFIERVMLRIPDKDCTESQFNEAIDAAMREGPK